MDYPNDHNAIKLKLKIRKHPQFWSKGDVTTEEQSKRRNISGFEDGQRGPETGECGKPLEAKEKETESSLELPHRNTALQTS